MKKVSLLLAGLLLAGLLLVLVSRGPAAAQQFYRMGHANRSGTLKAERSNHHVRHRDKKNLKKHKPDNGEGRRPKESKRQQERRAAETGSDPDAS